MSLDRQTSKGTSEVVVMDRAGRVLTTIPGATVSGIRLSPEIPDKFSLRGQFAGILKLAVISAYVLL
jgi:hypothetical protein